MTHWGLRGTALLAVGLAATVAPMAAAVADPAGNNGTVKIDSQVFDDAPDNQPHVGCKFQVDWYGFDEGPDIVSNVTFELQPPTGTDVLRHDKVFVGYDAAGGGTDLDASKTYDLSADLNGYTPQPKQGYHVKLTIETGGAQGADVKHKVFWVQNCGGS